MRWRRLGRTEEQVWSQTIQKEVATQFVSAPFVHSYLENWSERWKFLVYRKWRIPRGKFPSGKIRNWFCFCILDQICFCSNKSVCRSFWSFPQKDLDWKSTSQSHYWFHWFLIVFEIFSSQKTFLKIFLQHWKHLATSLRQPTLRVNNPISHTHTPPPPPATIDYMDSEDKSLHIFWRSVCVQTMASLFNKLIAFDWSGCFIGWGIISREIVSHQNSKSCKVKVTCPKKSSC